MTKIISKEYNSVVFKIKEKNMLAKIWKKICILILIVACLFDIVIKLVDKVSFNKEALSSAKYMYEEYLSEKNENIIK